MDFKSFIEGLNLGQTNAELNHELQKALDSVRNTGKQSVLTLKLKFANASKNNSLSVDKVTVTPTIDLALPKHESEADFYWLTENSELSRKHPKQQELELRDTEKVIEFKNKSI